jgi:uncharacterized protein YegL
MSAVDYGSNPNQRTPCVLVLDASGSMESLGANGVTRIDALNAGIQTLEAHLKSDDTAISRVQLAIVSVGGPTNDAEIMMDWTDVSNFSAFPLRSGGSTPLGKGVKLALEMIENSKQNLRAAGISYTRPWLMVISDGEPTDENSIWTTAATECKSLEASKKVEVFPIGVEGANLAMLGQLSIKPPILLEGVRFDELFVWLSSSLSAASRSRPGDTLQLPTTDPWRNVGM